MFGIMINNNIQIFKNHKQHGIILSTMNLLMIIVIQYRLYFLRIKLTIILTFMASYIQTTIHSKIAKQQKAPSEGTGNIIRGRVHAGRIQPSSQTDQLKQLDIGRQIEILPKNKVNINRKMRNKVIPMQHRGEEIILMESGVFPAIYFKKTTMRNVLKEFVFPQDVRALPPTDDRTPLIFQIVSNLFNEITFYIFNILIGENTISGSFYVFFSDSQTIPFTKCCNAPVYIQLQSSGSGKILCNALKCQHSNIAQFLINFQDGKKLWNNITYFSQASDRDKQLRHRISKVIMNGKYKKVNLVNIVQETSKQIVDLFYTMKKNDGGREVEQQEQVEEGGEGENPFLTAGQHRGTTHPKAEEGEEGNIVDALEELVDESEGKKGVELLKMKLGCVIRQERGMSRKVARSLVSEGKVFQKNFQMIKKIDQFMLTQKSSKHSTRLNFPRLMDQLRKTKQKQQRSKAKSAYKSFT